MNEFCVINNGPVIKNGVVVDGWKLERNGKLGLKLAAECIEEHLNVQMVIKLFFQFLNHKAKRIFKKAKSFFFCFWIIKADLEF